MDKPGAKCPELTAQTASALDDSILQQLFVSTQQNNLELCIEYAVRRWVIILIFDRGTLNWTYRYIVPEVIKIGEGSNTISAFIRNLGGRQLGEGEVWIALTSILSWFPHTVVSKS